MDVPWKKDDSLLWIAKAGLSRRTAAVGFRVCDSCMLAKAIVEPKPQQVVYVPYREKRPSSLE